MVDIEFLVPVRWERCRAGGVAREYLIQRFWSLTIWTVLVLDVRILNVNRERAAMWRCATRLDACVDGSEAAIDITLP